MTEAVIAKDIFDVKELYSLEGDFIGYIPTNRFHWYIKKELCTILNDSAIQLKFAPNCDHKIVRERVNCKENVCIVCHCSTISSLKRFRVIPFELKKYFPVDYKEHKFSDLVVLCKQHAGEGEKFHQKFKNKLYKQYDMSPKWFHVDSKLLHVYIKAKKLVEHNYVYSNEHAQRQFKEYFGGHSPSEDEIQGVIDQVKSFTYEGFESVDQMLIDRVLRSELKSTSSDNEHAVLDKFVKNWKEEFIEYMHPEIIPCDYWSVEQ
jgi:hypothetical protein